MSNPIEIIYVFDPMCGWCYAFSENIGKAEESYKDVFTFKIVSGGMILGEREGPVGEFSNYILGAIPRVSSMSGAIFGEAYQEQLKDKSLYLSSVMPSVALEIIKQHQPEIAFRFASAMQKAHFLEGKNLSSLETYIPLAHSFGFEPKLLTDNLETAASLKLAENEFAWTRQTGISGYPAVLIHVNNNYYRLCNGYVSYEELENGLEQLRQLL